MQGLKSLANGLDQGLKSLANGLDQGLKSLANIELHYNYIATYVCYKMINMDNKYV